jgi:CDP-diacylglycerol--serine O-phosphatidyltransferase
MGSTESKAFTGLPIPGAGTVIASLVLFHYEVLGGQVERSYMVLSLPFLLAVLMVSTLKFHALKEIDFKKRKPFWLLVAIGTAFVLIIMYPEIVIFTFAIIYVSWGIIEGSYLIHKNRRYREVI